jgi:hypothetical protein
MKRPAAVLESIGPLILYSRVMEGIEICTTRLRREKRVLNSFSLNFSVFLCTIIVNVCVCVCVCAILGGCEENDSVHGWSLS